MAVDGAIITAGPGLRRYFAGSLAQELAPLPETLRRATALQSVAEGSLIIMTDSRSGRLGAITFDGQALALDRQYLAGDEPIIAAVADSNASMVYAISGSKLVRFALIP
jgi:hypothetical protein